jgi:hypothetical protein
MEEYFKKYRDSIIGIDQTFQSPYGEKKIVYADWIASGRLYRPIEEKITNQFGLNDQGLPPGAKKDQGTC